jgi:hypothetical protein
VREPEFFDALPVRAYDCGVSTELGLGEHNTNAHSAFNHAAPRLLPAQPNPHDWLAAAIRLRPGLPGLGRRG